MNPKNKAALITLAWIAVIAVGVSFYVADQKKKKDGFH